MLVAIGEKGNEYHSNKEMAPVYIEPMVIVCSILCLQALFFFPLHCCHVISFCFQCRFYRMTPITCAFLKLFYEYVKIISVCFTCTILKISSIGECQVYFEPPCVVYYLLFVL